MKNIYDGDPQINFNQTLKAFIKILNHYNRWSEIDTFNK